MYKYIEAQKAIDNADTIQKSYPKGIQNKLLRIIKDILTNPRSKVAIGSPEQLKHTDTEKWSRELTKKDRIVYSIVHGTNYGIEDDEIIIFHQYLGHYDDK